MKEDYEQIEELAKKKARQRTKKKKTDMKVSGKSVFRLRDLIKRKSRS